jgi:hypothetical protein
MSFFLSNFFKIKFRTQKNLPATPPPPQPHPHYGFGIKMTALLSSIQRYHCHPATATPHTTVNTIIHNHHNIFFKKPQNQGRLCSHPTTATATATRRIWYHSNRPALLYRLVPLPPRHCHPRTHPARRS